MKIADFMSAEYQNHALKKKLSTLFTLRSPGAFVTGKSSYGRVVHLIQ